MCCLETAKSLPPRFSTRNSRRVPTTVHSWNRSWNTNHYALAFLFIYFFPPFIFILCPYPNRHHFFQRVFGHPSSPSSPHGLLRTGGEGVTGVDYERVPLSLADATRAGSQVSAQSIAGGALLHDPLQHLPDPAGHVNTGVCCAPVPQQLYVCLTETLHCTSYNIIFSFTFNAWLWMLLQVSPVKWLGLSLGQNLVA